MVIYLLVMLSNRIINGTMQIAVTANVGAFRSEEDALAAIKERAEGEYPASDGWIQFNAKGSEISGDSLRDLLLFESCPTGDQ
jgi:hypothetical protein